jgi:hypothetical protein
VAKAFTDTPDIVGVDTTMKENAPRAFLRIQRQRAESLGIPAQVIAQTVYTALSGADAAYLHDGNAKFAVPVRLQLPRESQVGAWASIQSRPLDVRETFEARIAEMAARFEGRDVPRPARWTGWRVVPQVIEFWQDRDNRLHERLVFTRAGNGWSEGLLYP